ncbi:hypothetical protein [Rugamonas sp.]|uniref:hypothetical protein n=1 Tax=Rugamonas sp. TaxID=1926287 RepID=UPI0025FC5013|nr:hypothetical protein [Rugamonas sp.]
MIVSHDASIWDAAAALPLEQRLGAAPAELVAHVNAVNALSGASNVRAASVPDDFRDDVRAAVDELPAAVKALLRENYLGVYFTHALGSSAITDIVVTPASEFLGIVTALDADAFIARSANEWASWKENTPFAPSRYAVEVRIAAPAQDNRKNAIQYLLLHELGHALAAGRTLLPDWWLGADQIQPADSYSFLPISWRIDANGAILPLDAYDFAARAQLSFYSGPQLAGAQMLPIYQALQRTDFFTLYSCVSAHEDFAESFASYVHMQLLHKPMSVRVLHDGAPVLALNMDWNDARFARKAALLGRLLRQD